MAQKKPTKKKVALKKLSARNVRSRRSAPRKMAIGAAMQAMGGDGNGDVPPDEKDPDESESSA